MTIFTPEHDGMIGGDGIERGFGRETIAWPLILVPLAALNPVSLRSLGGTFTHKFGHRLLTQSITGVDVVVTISGTDQMDVGIDKAGKERFAVEVDSLAEAVGRAAHLVVAAHG